MAIVILNTRELIRFYDDEPNARIHSNAVKNVAGEELGLALLEHYLESQGRSPRRIMSPCKTNGARLDGWIAVEHPKKLLYQVEVKSWSMHGYGSSKHRLGVDASPDQVAKYKKEVWGHYWEAGTFKEKSLKKVLRKMTLPSDHAGPVEPVACLWVAVHPEGADEPFFRVRPDEGDFKCVHVFSASAYLRGLKAGNGFTEVKVKLPNTVRRMEYLSTLFRNA